MSPIKSNLINRSHETSAHYVSVWERLSGALSHATTLTGMSEAEAQKALCQAISDGAVGIRGKLGTHTTKLLHASNTVLGGTDFSLHGIGDIHWRKSYERLCEK